MFPRGRGEPVREDHSVPCVTLHLALAERTLGAWRPRRPLFDARDPVAVNAFRQGAFGPDLGYFPGGHRPLSDLAHCVSVGDLTRALVDGARTAVERAFAFGWATHVLADHAIHPLIACAVGELLHGRPDRSVDGDVDPVAHVRVEAGLDAFWARRWPTLRWLPARPVFDERSAGFLARAYAQTYAVRFPHEPLLRSHRLAVRRARQGLHLAAWSARLLGAEAHRRPELRLEWGTGGLGARVRRALGHSSLPLAFLLPAAPPAWLRAAVDQAMAVLPLLFIEEVESGFAGVGNWNLDTGRLEGADPAHGGRCRALAALAELALAA
jgi:hypothetical protein